MKSCYLISFICLAVINISSCERDGKFIAALVSFPSDSCTANNEVGVCFSKKKCTRMGGTNLGTCAHGYGQCCKFVAQCSANDDSVTVTRNLTTLVTPTVLPKTCTFNFPKQPGVCQLRLDFPKFNLNDPMANGDCVTDAMSVTGTVTVNDLSICGMGTSAANHMYLDYGSSDNIQLRMRTNGSSTINMYGYEVRVTQIKCNSAKRVPQDCLQYYTEQTGVVSSFNYAKQQLNNENYRVCIEKQSPEDQIQWRLCNGTNDMVGAVNPDNMCLIGDTSAGCGNVPAPDPSLGNQPCSEDYVEIPGSPASRYCRQPFPAVVTTPNFWLVVHMDQTERQVLPPGLNPNPPQPCSAYANQNLSDYIMSTDPNGNCIFTPRGVDIMNKGFCLAYTVV